MINIHNFLFFTDSRLFEFWLCFQNSNLEFWLWFYNSDSNLRICHQWSISAKNHNSNRLFPWPSRYNIELPSELFLSFKVVIHFFCCLLQFHPSAPSINIIEVWGKVDPPFVHHQCVISPMKRKMYNICSICGSSSVNGVDRDSRVKQTHACKQYW